MSEASEVADFLLSDESYVVFGLGRLNYSIEGFRVDTGGYREIGHKIRQGAVEVVAARSSPGSRLAAVYTPRLDRLSVPAGLDLHSAGPDRIANQSMIVHEVTHALVDFHRFRTSVAVDEACAYLAGQLYAMSLGLRQRTSDRRSSAILEAAQTVVARRRMVASTGAILYARDPDVAALVQAVRGHTHAYPDADASHRGDGIRGGLVDPWYLPRH